MAECKHVNTYADWDKGTVICAECGADVMDELEQQIQQERDNVKRQQATIAAMRLAYEDIKANDYLTPEAADVFRATTAGAELLDKIKRLERENKAMRCCGNCEHDGSDGCIEDYVFCDKDLSGWELDEWLVKKDE